MPPPTLDASESVPPPTADVADLVSPPEGEADVDTELEVFGGDLVDVSLFPIYSNHIARHI